MLDYWLWATATKATPSSGATLQAALEEAPMQKLSWKVGIDAFVVQLSQRGELHTSNLGHLFGPDGCAWVERQVAEGRAST